ncbi:hypothetical protein Tco_1068146 [Tanacetum coccineum]|uniref:Uncharacterized protein n=1 Tax=Tanacetum coccineum TaxID=301880 RepID=A0ABQ5HG97_9ASTR
MEYVKKSIDERALHKREYDIWVNEIQMLTTEDKVDSSKALDARLVDADIRPIYDEEPVTEQRFALKVDVNNDLSKPVTTHYLPKERESAIAKPHYLIAPGSSRYNSNDMVHKHYLEEAKKKTQESSRNSET